MFAVNHLFEALPKSLIPVSAVHGLLQQHILVKRRQRLPLCKTRESAKQLPSLSTVPVCLIAHQINYVLQILFLGCSHDHFPRTRYTTTEPI
jgi:hypothetical protein